MERMATFKHEFGGTTAKQRKNLLKVLGMDENNSTKADIIARLDATCRGTDGDPFRHAAMRSHAKLRVCPTSYAIARWAGIDLAGLAFLERLSFSVTLSWPDYPHPMGGALRTDPDDARRQIASAPVVIGPGIIWDAGPSHAQVAILEDVSPLPDTALAAAVGRPLTDLLSHPLIPASVMVDDVEWRKDMWHVHLSGLPPRMALRDVHLLHQTTREA